MPIEGPLRELDIHDLIQLLDLSRKTGALRVTSAQRDNVGTVYFDGGQVVYATVRSNPHPLGAMLVRSGRVTDAELARARARQTEGGDARRLGDILVEEGLISARELDRQLRLQIEAVVFELLSWDEGFFSFAEQDVRELPADATVRMSAESLLMEAARRMDEWGTIADRVPSLDVVPSLAPAEDDAPPLDLAPDEWTVLAAVDGVRDLRTIAAGLGRSELEVGKMAARLVKARVLRVDTRRPAVPSPAAPSAADRERAAERARGYSAARAGDLGGAIAAWRGWLRDAPAGAARDATAEALEAAVRLHALLERHVTS